MADVIELEKRRQQQDSIKADWLRNEQIHLLKKILQCARCQLKCSRCGSQTQEGAEARLPGLPYPLCSGCREEYEAYLKLCRGETACGRYWRNTEWMQIWRTWLEHQQALDNFRNSKEFVKLLHEFDSLW